MNKLATLTRNSFVNNLHHISSVAATSASSLWSSTTKLLPSIRSTYTQASTKVYGLKTSLNERYASVISCVQTHIGPNSGNPPFLDLSLLFAHKFGQNLSYYLQNIAFGAGGLAVGCVALQTTPVTAGLTAITGLAGTYVLDKGWNTFLKIYGADKEIKFNEPEKGPVSIASSKYTCGLVASAALMTGVLSPLGFFLAISIKAGYDEFS